MRPERFTGAATAGPDDDFFDLGGSSLGAMELAERARAAGLDVGVREVFVHRTAAGMLGEG